MDPELLTSSSLSGAKKGAPGRRSTVPARPCAQAVPITVEQSCMTQWFRPVNAFTQYSKDHFLDKNLGEDELLAGCAASHGCQKRQ